MSNRNNQQIAIIGMGTRGLAILERIIANERVKNPAYTITLTIFDQNTPGVGCHNISQPDHLLVNTVASQITVFSDESVINAKHILKGPSFYEWIVEHGDTFGITNPNPNKYYPRRIFGNYLNWCYNYLLSKLPAHMSVRHIQSNVVTMDIISDTKILLKDEHSLVYELDYCFITTGHTIKQNKNKHSAIIDNVYPIQEKLSRINQQHTVVIEGWGLTAFDVISELSIGRGGNFLRSENGKLKYIKSGQEPKIHIYSRSGIPLSARANNQKSVSQQYKPKFFTYNYIDSLRTKKPSLDFEQDILPTLITELEYVYYKTYFKNHGIDIKEFDYFFSNQRSNTDFKLAFLKDIPLDDRFSWAELVDPIPQNILSDQDQFEIWLKQYMQNDIEEAYQGNIDSPIKAATDAIRDIRDILRYAIDFRGLTEESHKILYSKYIPLMNRLAVGPPKERIEQVLALREANVIVSFQLPNTQTALKNDQLYLIPNDKAVPPFKINYLLRSRISTHSPIEDGTLLIQNLLHNKLVKLYYNGDFHPGGIEITKQFNVINQDGTAIPNLYALGMLVEGIKFYTFIVPRPGVNSTAISDAGTAVVDMLTKIKNKFGEINE